MIYNFCRQRFQFASHRLLPEQTSIAMNSQIVHSYYLFAQILLVRGKGSGRGNWIMCLK